MAWLLTEALDRYAGATGRLLLECPAENTIMLGAAATPRYALYQRLGYRPVSDRSTWSFTSAAG